MCRVHEEDMAFDFHHQPLEGCTKKPRKCAEFTRKTWPSISTFNHSRDALRSQRNAAELTRWSAKLVTPVSPRTNSAEEILTHMSALRSLPSHLILITATPQSGTPKSCMARWVQGSAAGTETGRRSSSARRKHLILITATPRFGTRK